jgi:hypothetical protein
VTVFREKLQHQPSTFTSVFELTTPTFEYNLSSPVYPKDPFLTPEILDELNTVREQFADRQDMYSPEEVKYDPSILTRIEKQLRSHLEEHALNRHIFNFYYFLDNGRLKSPYQATKKPFTHERLQDLLRESTTYLEERFGTIPTEEEVAWLDKNFEEVANDIFSPDFYKTRVGLELAELIGLRRFEKMAAVSSAEDVVLLFSPYSPLRYRQEEINEKEDGRQQYHFTMVGKKGISKEGLGIVSMISARTDSPLPEYLNTYNSWYKQFGGIDFKADSAQAAVSLPIPIPGRTSEDILEALGVVTNPKILELFDIAIAENKEILSKLIVMMTSGKHTVNEVAKARRELEKAVVSSHKRLVSEYRERKVVSKEEDRLFTFIQNGYLAGGMCGSSMFSDFMKNGITTGMEVDAGDGKGPLEFECPKCNRMVTRPFGGLISHCPHCNSSVQC